jgi:hypothetical protein
MFGGLGHRDSKEQKAIMKLIKTHMPLLVTVAQ